MQKRVRTLSLTAVLAVFGSNSLAQERAPIIDMHLHSYDEHNYFIAPDQHGKMAPPTVEAHFAATYKIMRDNDIVIGVISNNLSAEVAWMDKDEDGRFLRGFGWYRVADDLLADFEALARAGEIDVFGEIGAFYSGMTLADPVFAPYLEICEDLGIPVAIHSGGGPPGINYRGAPDARISHGDPLLIEGVLVRYPKLKVYLMHGGGPYYEEALRLMASHPQVYADLGVVLWVHDIPKYYGKQFLQRAKEFGLLDRVMFGSDQMVWPHAIDASIELLNSYDFLTAEEKRDIFYNNAARFLGLSDEQIAAHHRN